MKKVILPLCLLFVGLMFQSCIKDVENHELRIEHPNGISVLFADDVRDSLSFFTFDSYKLRSSVDWINLPHESSRQLTYDPNKYYFCISYLDIKKNDTGKSRYGSVVVDSYEYSAVAMYFQYSFLNIYKPAGQIESYFPDTNHSLPDSVSFTLADSASVELDSICFNVRDSWKLSLVENDVDWITLSSEKGGPGANSVQLEFMPNISTEDRQATLRLTSSGISNDIVVKQYGKVEEEK